MKVTTIKVSTETRDRIRALGGETHEDTIIEALDALEADRFWEQAEAGRRWLESLSAEERSNMRDEDDEIDRAFRSS